MLVTPSDLDVTLRYRDWSVADLQAVQQFNLDATADLEAWLGWAIEVADVTEDPVFADHDPQGYSTIFPQRVPLRTVVSLVADDPEDDDPTVVKVERDRVVVAGVPNSRVGFTFVYTAGLGNPVVTAAAKSAIRRRLTRLIQKVGDDSIGTERATFEAYSAAYFSEGFTEDELRPLKRYKRSVIVAAPATYSPGGTLVGGTFGGVTTDWAPS